MKLHAAALAENVAFDAARAVLASESPSVAEIGGTTVAEIPASVVTNEIVTLAASDEIVSLLDSANALPDASAIDCAPAVSVTVDINGNIHAEPAPVRIAVGNGSHVNPNLHPLLTFGGYPLNGLRASDGSAAPTSRDAATATVENRRTERAALTPADAPLLLARAATLIAATATRNAEPRTGASPLDRLMFLCRAAERCIYTADRIGAVNGKRPVRAFSGAYNNTDAVLLRIASVRSALETVTPDGMLDASKCDDAIVAYLAARVTATRTAPGYFAHNIGTRNR